MRFSVPFGRLLPLTVSHGSALADIRINSLNCYIYIMLTNYHLLITQEAFCDKIEKKYGKRGELWTRLDSIHFVIQRA